MKKSIFSWLYPKKKRIGSEQTIRLTPTLPFFPKAISHLERAPDGSYYKVIYGMNKKGELTRLPVASKKGKNYPLIFNEFMSTLKIYLDINGEKILEPPKPRLSIWHFCLLLAFTSLASAISLQFLLNTVWTGLLSSSISIFSLYLVFETRTKDILDIKAFGRSKRAYEGLAQYYQENQGRVKGSHEYNITTSSKEKAQEKKSAVAKTTTKPKSSRDKKSKVIPFAPKSANVSAKFSKNEHESPQLILGPEIDVLERPVYKATIISNVVPAQPNAFESSLKPNPNHTRFTPIAPLEKHPETMKHSRPKNRTLRLTKPTKPSDEDSKAA